MATTTPMMRPLGCIRTAWQPSVLGRRSVSTIYTPRPDPVALPSKLPKVFNAQLPTRLRPDQGKKQQTPDPRNSEYADC